MSSIASSKVGAGERGGRFCPEAACVPVAEPVPPAVSSQIFASEPHDPLMLATNFGVNPSGRAP
ncbi:MAG: hypothetical protein H6837_12070 [Planctomycetes bacterium]|nr:hypothetical protein [Planctomycetota bacterium]